VQRALCVLRGLFDFFAGLVFAAGAVVLVYFLIHLSTYELNASVFPERALQALLDLAFLLCTLLCCAIFFWCGTFELRLAWRGTMPRDSQVDEKAE